MGTIFDKYKLLHGFPMDGQKVRYVKPTKHAWFKSVIERENDLTLGEEYTVKKTELNSSSSYIWLEECPDTEWDAARNGRFFNLGAFEWDFPEIHPKDLIGFEMYDLHRLDGKNGYSIDKKTYALSKNGKPFFTPYFDETTGIIWDYAEREDPEHEYKGADAD